MNNYQAQKNAADILGTLYAISAHYDAETTGNHKRAGAILTKLMRNLITPLQCFIELSEFNSDIRGNVKSMYTECADKVMMTDFPKLGATPSANLKKIGERHWDTFLTSKRGMFGAFAYADGSHFLCKYKKSA